MTISTFKTQAQMAAVEHLSWCSLHKAVKSYAKIGNLADFRSRGINQPLLSNLDTNIMSDVDHMRYACALEILSIPSEY